MKRSYRVLARLGEGGMATVYLAMIGRPDGFRKLVALKVLRDQPGANSEELRQMFAREARVSARCHHRNVVQILDVCELDGRPALCMEYLDGQTYRQLRARAARQGTLPLFEQLRILAEAAHGLHHVHRLTDYEGRPLGLVHCDVSPENIFVTYDGQVKLLDFGVAKLHDDARQPGFHGKLSYVAPELITGAPVDARADVFALGAMLWEAVCVAPFAGGPSVDDGTKLRNRLTGAEGSIRGIKPEAPEALAEIVDRSIAIDPAQRFADADAFACALESYLELTGAQPSAQSLSRLVGPMFAREVATLRATTEPQLQLAERWDREHESSSPGRARSLGMRGEPEVPFDFTLGEQTELAPAGPSAAAFSSPADTVVPWPERHARKKKLAPFLLVALAGLGAGALLGGLNPRDDAPEASAVTPAVPVAGSSAPAPTASAPPANEAARNAAARAPLAQTNAPVQIHGDDRAATLESPPCVTTALVLQSEIRRLATSEARRARHHQRRLRRRAAQCAAGRTEKCAPIQEPM